MLCDAMETSKVVLLENTYFHEKWFSTGKPLAMKLQGRMDEVLDILCLWSTYKREASSKYFYMW